MQGKADVIVLVAFVGCMYRFSFRIMPFRGRTGAWCDVLKRIPVL